ncbi:uncharacterized protein LOC135819101 isoform X2 [Sycon ciliatum]|uniref:uncharacterized protein LOC135819101 isoform X2 n=1 Tax=Sycon ciliatum TaxID=27933 RepID=UPI0020A87DD0|eukprot:scpid54329/ scgid5178/ 
MEVEKAPAYKESLLLEDEEATKRAQRRKCCKERSGKRGVLVVAIGLALMAGMFLAGWYGGQRHHDDHDKHHHNEQPQYQYQSPSDYYQMSQGSDGSYLNKPVLEGSVPVTDFVMCNFANGTQCQSGNPMLTPKGTIQVTLYKNNGQTSFIVTSTGENYGEALSTLRKKRSVASTVKTYLNRLHFTNCDANLFSPIQNDYKQLDKGIHIDFNYSSITSHTHIINLLGDLPAAGCNISFDKAPVNHLFSVRGGDDIMTSDSDTIPQPSVPLFIKNMKSMLPSFEPGPVDLTQFKVPKIDMSSAFDGAPDVQIGPLTVSGRKRRSFFSDIGDVVHDIGTVYQIVHPITKAVESTIKILHDKSHGGTNGTITYDVTNHTAQCRSRFSMLYHDALHDVSGLVSSARDHQTFMFRHQNSAGWKNLSMWQSVTPLVNQAASSVHSLVGQIPGVLPCFTHELGELKTRVQSFASKLGLGRKKRFLGLSWKCNVFDSVKQGFECGHSAFDCGDDILNTEDSFGLSLIKGVHDCYDAGDDCYHLVHNCVGGL